MMIKSESLGGGAVDPDISIFFNALGDSSVQPRYRSYTSGPYYQCFRTRSVGITWQSLTRDMVPLRPTELEFAH